MTDRNRTQHGVLTFQLLGEKWPVQVLYSQSGFFIGTEDDLGLTVSRESEEYFGTLDSAKEALATGNWTQRIRT